MVRLFGLLLFSVKDVQLVACCYNGVSWVFILQPMDYSLTTLLVVLSTLLPIQSEKVQGEDNLTDLQSQLKFLAQQLQTCQGDTPSNVFDMKLHSLDKNTTCNDGSPAG